MADDFAIDVQHEMDAALPCQEGGTSGGILPCVQLMHLRPGFRVARTA